MAVLLPRETRGRRKVGLPRPVLVRSDAGIKPVHLGVGLRAVVVVAGAQLLQFGALGGVEGLNRGVISFVSFGRAEQGQGLVRAVGFQLG